MSKTILPIRRYMWLRFDMPLFYFLTIFFSWTHSQHVFEEKMSIIWGICSTIHTDSHQESGHEMGFCDESQWNHWLVQIKVTLDTSQLMGTLLWQGPQPQQQTKHLQFVTRSRWNIMAEITYKIGTQLVTNTTPAWYRSCAYDIENFVIMPKLLWTDRKVYSSGKYEAI